MTTAAAPADAGRRPPAVRALIRLCQLTAVATIAVELLNFWYAPEQGFGLAVRTGWALLRSIGFLVLVWHLRRGRAGARPFGLILAVTTVFAVGRLLVPRTGVPPLPGIVGFVAFTALCVAVVWLLYRSPSVAAHLVRHQPRLVIDRGGLGWRESAPKGPAVPGWLLTSRVAAFTYPPLMLVPCLAAIGEVDDAGLSAVPLIVLWFGAGIAAGFSVGFTMIFLLRGQRWARRLLAVITAVVLLVDLSLCWVLLGVDGLVRDGAPLLAAAALALYGTWRGGRLDRSKAAGPAGPAGPGGAAARQAPAATARSGKA